MLRSKPRTRDKNPPPVDYKNSRPCRTNLRIASENARSLVLRILIRYHRTRDRKLTKSEFSTYKKHFEIILLDLFSAYSAHPKLWVGYSRGKNNFLKDGRYFDPITNTGYVTQVPYLKTIDYLAETGLLENWTASSGYSKISSRMRATAELQELFNRFNLNWTSIRENGDTAPIIVKNKGKIVPYPESGNFPLQESFKNLRRINTNLENAYLNLNLSDDKYFELQEKLLSERSTEEFESDLREPIDFSQRQLKRIFANGTFNDGGRIYGGWWQHVPSELRRHIEIDGNVVVELDYSTMAPRILYSQVGVDAPEDSYSIEGWHNELRPIIKKAFNQLLNSSETSRNPNQWHRFAPDIDIGIDKSTLEQNILRMQRNVEFEKKFNRPYSDLLSDLLDLHSPISHLFFSSRWTEMQRIDSDIAETVLTTLLDNVPPITALPIHDSFIVSRGNENILRNAMSDAFYRITNVEPNIDRDETVFDSKNEKAFYPIVISGPELHEETKKNILGHSKFHKREEEWRSAHGLTTFA